MLEIAAFVISSICMIINGYLLFKVRKLNNSDDIKKSWSQLSNPNSYESKQLKRSVPTPKRR